MSVNIFLDTNVLVYSYSKNELAKQSKARLLISNEHSYISTQVIQEFTNTVTKKFAFSYENAQEAINECCKNNFLHVNTGTTIYQACSIADIYKFSFYDSLIISAALECQCIELYSEDMQDGQIINDVLRITNPFK